MEQDKIDQIIRLHIEKKRSYAEIGRIAGVSDMTAARHVKAYEAKKVAQKQARLTQLDNAREVWAKKRAAQKRAAQKPVPMPKVPLQRGDSQESGIDIIVMPRSEATLREVAAAAHTLGLEVHFRFVQKHV